MALTMRPTGLGSGAYQDNVDYNVFSGEWLIGRIYEVRGGPGHLRCTFPVSRKTYAQITAWRRLKRQRRSSRRAGSSGWRGQVRGGGGE
jgi:hypothetical protein